MWKPKHSCTSELNRGPVKRRGGLLKNGENETPGGTAALSVVKSQGLKKKRKHSSALFYPARSLTFMFPTDSPDCVVGPVDVTSNQYHDYFKLLP